jgi:hypothetical protein
MKLPVMKLPPLLKQISLVLKMMMVVDLFSIKQVASTGSRNQIAVSSTDQCILKLPVGLAGYYIYRSALFCHSIANRMLLMELIWLFQCVKLHIKEPGCGLNVSR